MSPAHMTFAGPAGDMKAFLKQLEEEGIFNRALDTKGVAYHSSVLQPLLPELIKCEWPLVCLVCRAHAVHAGLLISHKMSFYCPFLRMSGTKTAIAHLA